MHTFTDREVKLVDMWNIYDCTSRFYTENQEKKKWIMQNRKREKRV